jgi:single-stranded DNA-binding protein
MSLFALASGTLFRAPERKIAKSGAAYVAAKLRVGDGDATQWIHLVAFASDARDELADLNAGAACAVQGRLTAEVYTPAAGGSPRVSLSIAVVSVLPLKRRKRKQPAMASAAPPTQYDFNDDYPEGFGG